MASSVLLCFVCLAAAPGQQLKQLKERTADRVCMSTMGTMGGQLCLQNGDKKIDRVKSVGARKVFFDCERE